MKILKVGKWSNTGFPSGFVFQTEDGDQDELNGNYLRVSKAGEVRIGGVEVVEWSEARKAAMGKNGTMPKGKKVKMPDVPRITPAAGPEDVQ